MSISKLIYSGRMYQQESQSQNPIVWQLEEKIIQLNQKLRTEEARLVRLNSTETIQNELKLMVFLRDELIEKEVVLQKIKELEEKYSEFSKALLDRTDCTKIMATAFLIGLIGPVTSDFFELSPAHRDFVNFLANQVDLKQITDVISNKPVQVPSTERTVRDKGSLEMTRFEQLMEKIDQLEQSLERGFYWVKKDSDIESIKKDLDLMTSVRDEIINKAKAVSKMIEIKEKACTLARNILQLQSKCEERAKLARAGAGIIKNVAFPLSKVNPPGIF